MGTEGDVPRSRPPRIEDLVRLCRRLNEAGALYVVIGGFAMILHGYTRGTMDVDLLVDPAPDNIRRVKAARPWTVSTSLTRTWKPSSAPRTRFARRTPKTCSS